MKKQTGFTLIELLLVLAIIGIISAIAIPALLGQRARARDKSCTENAFSMTADIVAAYDKGNEAGCPVSVPGDIWNILTTAVAPLPQALSAHVMEDKNPWAGVGGAPARAYNQAIVALPTVNEVGARGMGAAAGNLGQVWSGFVAPVPATGMAGGCATSVWVQNPFKDGAGVQQNIYVKIAAID
jgi:prepilin-type N-terminal cleavage/methylation domain-containing protein